MRRRWTMIMGTLLVILCLAAAFLYLKTERLAAAHQVELSDMLEQAASAGAQARSQLRQDQYDLKIEIGRPFLETVLTQLKGLEVMTSKGNHLVIDQADVTIDDGYVLINVRAQLKSVLYSGEVEAAYYGFTRFLEDGRCILELRVARARPKDLPGIRGTWLEPWLVARMQKKLKLPEIILPLGFQKELSLPAVDKTIESKGLTISIPARKLDIALTNPTVWVHEQGVLLLCGIADSAFAEPQPEQALETTSAELNLPVAPYEGLSVTFRMSKLSQLLAALLKPEQDILLKAEHMPDVWRQDKKLLGIRIKNRADLHQVDGYLDLVKARLEAGPNQQLTMELEVTGTVDGVVKGKAYGFKLNHPFRVNPTMKERVPIGISHREGDLYIYWPPQEIDIDLDVELSLRSRQVSFKHQLTLNTVDILRPISLPQWFRKSVSLPTRVVHKKVVDSRTLPLRLDWEMALPSDNQGHLQLRGVLNLAEPSQPSAQ